jgi:hypothetical protein
MSLLSSLLARRVILVTGKGGTGRSTFSMALALAATRRGLRVLVVEMNGAASAPQFLEFDVSGASGATLQEGLQWASVSAPNALEEFVSRQLRSKALYRLVFRNRVMGPFIDAVPGLPELIQLGKIYDLAIERRNGAFTHDFIVVDAPATGHGLSLLEAPRAMLELTRAGPIHHNTGLVDAFFGDPSRAAVVLTTLPEAMPTSEFREMRVKLSEKGRKILCCVVNQCWPPLPEALDVRDAPFDPRLQLWRDRLLRQAQHRQSLEQGLDCPILPLPFLFERRIRLAHLEALANRIEAAP